MIFGSLCKHGYLKLVYTTHACTHIGGKDAYDICRLLKPAAAKWYEIGVLLKVDAGLLVTYEQRCKTDEQRLHSMISAWLQQQKMNRTYDKIVKVLRKKGINEKGVAAEIKKVIGKLTVQAIYTFIMIFRDLVCIFSMCVYTL